MSDDFKRKLPTNNPGKMKAFSVSTRKVDDKNTVSKEKPKKKIISLNSRLGLWSYTVGVLSLGFTVGYPVGSNSTPSDSELINQVSYYKKENLKYKSENEILNDQIKLSKKANDEVNVKLKNSDSENATLTEQLNMAKNQLQQKEEELQIKNSNNKNTSLESPSSTGPTYQESEIALNQTVNYLNNEVYVSVSYIGLNTADITVGSTGYDSDKRRSYSTGDQFVYQAASKYEIRITHINSREDKIKVQVSKVK
ncbi:hypothetical protein FAY30_24270 [Bacillus sp. S3]|uniref:hypothetical protein n=1 Tax=Bacillus sp. S3 TaxID=486398 RepID=UPI00118AB4C4|nr:hypothetical protein [Bacillus sp. S3]QCJ44746.1 hypothetical protein FAY30_24270 [Bacillus sp. S3]